MYLGVVLWWRKLIPLVFNGCMNVTKMRPLNRAPDVRGNGTQASCKAPLNAPSKRGDCNRKKDLSLPFLICSMFFCTNDKTQVWIMQYKMELKWLFDGRYLFQRGHQCAQALLQTRTITLDAMVGSCFQHLNQRLGQWIVDGGALAVDEIGQTVRCWIILGKRYLQHYHMPIGCDTDHRMPLDGIQHFYIDVWYIRVEQREFVLQRIQWQWAVVGRWYRLRMLFGRG